MTLRLSIDERGSVTEIERISGFAALAQAAEKAARTCRFEPAIRNGEAVSSETELSYRFTLEGGTQGHAESAVSLSPTPVPSPQPFVPGKPKRLFAPTPVYPREAQRKGIVGTVVLEVVIDEYGKVEQALVVRGLPCGLTEAAEQAVKQWRYSPTTSKEHGLPRRFTVKIRFGR